MVIINVYFLSNLEFDSTRSISPGEISTSGRIKGLELHYSSENRCRYNLVEIEIK